MLRILMLCVWSFCAGCHQITVITSNHDPKLKPVQTVDRIKVHRITTPDIKIFGLLNIWIKFLQFYKLAKRSDIIHIHDVIIWTLPLRLLLFNKPFYATHHGWEGAYPIPLKNVLLKRFSSLLATRSIAIGDYIPKYYGIKPDIISYGATDSHKKTKKKSKSILYLGRLSKDTGLPIFLNAAKNLKGYDINFCGDGDLADKCAKFGKVHGFINPEPLLRSSHFCVVSGYLSILEALSFGCTPIAIYDNPLKKDYFILSPFKKHLLLVGNSKELISKLNSKHSPKNASELVKTHSWDRLKNQYYKLWYNPV